MKKALIFTCLFAISCTTAFAQMSFGFKTGLNFSKFNGPLEMDANGNTEEFANNTGFHLAAAFGYSFNDYLGVRGELQYSQKGARQRYDGASYSILDLENGNKSIVTANQRLTVGVDNSYLDVPLMVYARPIKWLEVSAGANFGLLIGSTGIGEVRYSEAFSPIGSPIDDFSYDLSYNYGRDAFDDETPLTQSILVDGSVIGIPSIAGAYYNYDEDLGHYFNRFDMGLVVGLSVFLNKGLYVGGRFNYGLSDVTNNAYDRSLVSLNSDGSVIARDDVDRNSNIQVSVGFSF